MIKVALMMPNRSEEEKKIIFGIFAFRPIGSFPQTKTIAEERMRIISCH